MDDDITRLRLPHTGLWVPDNSLRLARYKATPTSGVPAVSANLYEWSRLVAHIENDGHGGDTFLTSAAGSGYTISAIEDYFNNYAARCRTADGRTIELPLLLDALLDEHQCGLMIRDIRLRKLMPLRLMNHVHSGGERRGAAFIDGYADSRRPTTDERWTNLNRQLLSQMPPGPHGWWQAWHDDEWRDVTERPEGVRTDLYR